MKIVGFGFRPTEVELVDFYLKLKLLDDPRAHVMTEIDLCNVAPWEVPVMLAKSVIPFSDREWFFFSPVDFKYSNSKRVNRRTKSGFWKPTGKDRDIRTWDTTTVIGTKKTLVFCIGRASKGVKAKWVIHEYHALNALTFHKNQKAFVLCRLIKKPGKTTEGGTDALICDEGESSRSVVSDCENQAIAGLPSGGTYTGMETVCEATHQADKCISPIEPSLIDIEQDEASSSNFASNNAYFRNENNIMQIPSETTQIPSETMEFSSETKQIPFETMEFSSETKQIPSETTQIPSETMQILSETKQIPSETMQILSETKQIPSSETIPKDVLNSLNSFLFNEVVLNLFLVYETLVIDEEALVYESLVIDEEAMQVPCEVTETLSEDMQAMLTETMQAMQAVLSEAMQAPLSEATQPPYDITQISSETTQTPCIHMQVPTEATQTPAEASFFNRSTQSKSLKRAYCESPYIDAEVVPKLDANIGDISIMYTKYLNSDEYYSSKRFKTSYDVAPGDTCLLFSNQEPNQEKQESIFQDDFWAEETSSCDSTTSKPLEINCFEISSFPCILRS